jgi:TolB protein
VRKILGLGILVGLLVSCRGGVTEAPTALDSPLQLDTSPALTSPVETPYPFKGVLAFHSNRHGALQVFVMDGNSGEVTGLTNDPIKALEPTWSPDCSAIAFTSGRDGVNSLEIYTMQADGSKQERLFENQPADDWAPAWSPDGETIAYQSNESGRINVCFAGSQGQEKGCLLANEFSNALPAWHPDGDQIVFVSDRGRDWDIYVAAVGGGDAQVLLLDNEYEDLYPQFSPDGESVVFASKRANVSDIFMIDADGTNERQLTSFAGDNATPRWVGTDHLVFASDRAGNWELYLMDVNAKNLARLTWSAGLDKWPAWCASSH